MHLSQIRRAFAGAALSVCPKILSVNHFPCLSPVFLLYCLLTGFHTRSNLTHAVSCTALRPYSKPKMEAIFPCLSSVFLPLLS